MNDIPSLGFTLIDRQKELDAKITKDNWQAYRDLVFFEVTTRMFYEDAGPVGFFMVVREEGKQTYFDRIYPEEIFNMPEDKRTVAGAIGRIVNEFLEHNNKVYRSMMDARIYMRDHPHI